MLFYLENCILEYNKKNKEKDGSAALGEKIIFREKNP